MQKLKWGAVLFVVLVGLGALAVAIGWGAHALVEWMAPTTFTPSPPPMEETPRLTPVLLRATATPHEPTPASTSTLAPTATQNLNVEIVLATDRGLYDVCRRHCPGLTDLERCASETARLNRLRGRKGEWRIDPGQSLQMPTCPPQ